MTTIVYRDGVLAADSQCQAEGYCQPGFVTKIWRIRYWLVAGTGDMDRIEAFRRWVESGMHVAPPEMGETSSGIIIEPGDLVREFGPVGEATRNVAPFHAWGTGMPVALGALYMGATAERAVEIAMLVDPGSGGATQALRL